MLLMSPSTVPRRSSERLETILAASRGHLEGLRRVGEAKMAPRCGLEGVLGSSWGRPGGVLRSSWGCPGGVLGVTVAKLALRGLRETVLRGSRGHLEGFARRRGC